MLIKKMTKIIKIIFSISFIFIFNSHASENNFETWLSNFKKIAISEGISEGVVNNIMGNAKFLPKVIEYDRFQPEFLDLPYKKLSDNFLILRKHDYFEFSFYWHVHACSF